MQGKSGEKKNQYEGVVGGVTNKNRTKLGGGRGRVKTAEKNQRNWEVGGRMKKTQGRWEEDKNKPYEATNCSIRSRDCL